MSDRLRFIKPKVQAEPRRVASALRKIATALDAADDCKEYQFFTGDLTDEGLGPVAHAWAQAALLIADMADVDSVTLRAMSAVIDKGEQRAFRF